MKKMSIISTILFLFVLTAYTQHSDKVVGVWLTEEQDSQVEIIKKSNGKFYGKIVWLKEDKDRKDEENPDAAMRNRKVLGLEILQGFKYNDAEKEWEEGIIYDPESGKTYDCYMWFDENNQLRIKGFVLGMRFLGRQTVWKKETGIRN